MGKRNKEHSTPFTENLFRLKKHISREKTPHCTKEYVIKYNDLLIKIFLLSVIPGPVL